MKRFLPLTGIILAVSVSAYYLEKKMSSDAIILDPVKADMNILKSYSEYLDYCETYLSVSPEAFSFGVPREAEFQAILQNAHLYVDLSKAVIADPNVSMDVKRGVTSAMLGLEVDELAAFVSYLNRQSSEKPELMELVKLASINYFIDTMRPRTNVMDYRLSEYADRPDVKAVFKAIYNNPNLDPVDRAEDGWLYKLAR